MPYRKFGVRVKERRKELKLTQEQLAERAGISYTFVGHIERGTRNCSVDTLVKLSNALMVSPNTLLRDSLEADQMDSYWELTKREKALLSELLDRIREYNSELEDEEEDEDDE